MTFDKPLPVRLREMWISGMQNGLSREEFNVIQSRELDQLAAIWTRALQLPGRDDFVDSTLHELGRWRGINDLAIVRGPLRECAPLPQTALGTDSTGS